MNIIEFKKEVEKTLLITDWSPSNSDLISIAIAIQQTKGFISKAGLEKIVIDVVGSYEALIMEGVDNTDLTTLLQMAMKIEKNDD